jgi:hypothetical protein
MQKLFFTIFFLPSFIQLFSQNMKPSPIVEINKPFHHLKYIYLGKTVSAPHLMRHLNNPDQPEPVLREIKKVHRNEAIKVSMIVLGFGLIIPEALVYDLATIYVNFGVDRVPYQAVISIPTILIESFACFFAVVQKKHNHRVMEAYNQFIN